MVFKPASLRWRRHAGRLGPWESTWQGGGAGGGDGRVWKVWEVWGCVAGEEGEALGRPRGSSVDIAGWDAARYQGRYNYRGYDL